MQLVLRTAIVFACVIGKNPREMPLTDLGESAKTRSNLRSNKRLRADTTLLVPAFLPKDGPAGGRWNL